jgi:hypothetical protein
MFSGISTCTLVHVAISLVAIGAGFVVLFGLIAAKRLDGWTALFLATTVATSVTGFGFPIQGFTPGIVLGIISLLVLAVAIFARYPRRLIGVWRPVFVITAVIALYLNFFVLIVQSFQKVPALKTLAPTHSDPPFLIAQLVASAAFIVLGALAVIRLCFSMTRSTRRPNTAACNRCSTQWTKPKRPATAHPMIPR